MGGTCDSQPTLHEEDVILSEMHQNETETQRCQKTEESLECRGAESNLFSVLRSLCSPGCGLLELLGVVH